MIKVLILEDDNIRHEAFKNNFLNCELTIVDNVIDCIEKLKHNNYDYLFLDHDLGGTTYAPSDEKSGCAVAKFLYFYPQFKPTKIFMHSLNVVGRNNMQGYLPEAVHAPFTWTKHLNFNNND